MELFFHVYEYLPNVIFHEGTKIEIHFPDFRACEMCPVIFEGFKPSVGMVIYWFKNDSAIFLGPNGVRCLQLTMLISTKKRKKMKINMLTPPKDHNRLM